MSEAKAAAAAAAFLASYTAWHGFLLVVTEEWLWRHFQILYPLKSSVLSVWLISELSTEGLVKGWLHSPVLRPEQNKWNLKKWIIVFYICETHWHLKWWDLLLLHEKYGGKYLLTIFAWSKKQWRVLAVIFFFFGRILLIVSTYCRWVVKHW